MDYSNPLSSLQSVAYSRQRSSRQCGVPGSSARPDGKEALTELMESNSDYMPLNMIIQVIESSGLRGPVVTTGQGDYLGQGGQFYVTRQDLALPDSTGFRIRPVAVKQPKFRLDHEEALRLGDEESKKHLRNIHVEIAALSHRALREHPNVVTLISWAFTRMAFHAPISLVMDLADCTLREFLQDSGGNVSSADLFEFCCDVAAGVDALHQNGFVHGDIKTDNILLFGYPNRYVARVADFGLCVTSATIEGVTEYLGGTEGWLAPEVEKGLRLTFPQLIAADNYGFGLLAWSIVFEAGDVPRHSLRDDPLARIEACLQDTRLQISPQLQSAMFCAIPNLLNRDANCRSERLCTFFPARDSDTDQHPFELLSMLEDDSNILFDYVTQESGHIIRPLPPDSVIVDALLPRYSWEVQGVSGEFVQGLCSTFLENPGSIDSKLLFSMFLSLAISPREIPGSRNPALDLLLAAAQSDTSLEGSLTAQAAVVPALEWFDFQAPPSVASHIVDYLRNGVTSGSPSARRILSERDPYLAKLALESFINHGGYNQWYSAVKATATPATENVVMDAGPGHSSVHSLAAYGTTQQMLQHLKTTRGSDVNLTTQDNETALYLACTRGSWEIASLLMDYGAQASHSCTAFGITCLHWVFQFDAETQENLVTRIQKCGGLLDARTKHPTPFPHYPFLLPAGTPLHWAVVTSSYSAIKTLVMKGSSLDIRDGSDPYIYEDRVRYRTNWGGPLPEAFSFSASVTQGLSPMDYAAMERDPYLFELIELLGVKVDINSVDEEGLSVLHRLSASHVRRSRTGVQFSFLPFRGSKPRAQEELRRVVESIKRLGGNFRLLTTPNILKAQPDTTLKAVHRYTPLMMAARGATPFPEPQIVSALLEGDTPIDAEDDSGQTALHFTCDDPANYEKILELLCSAGADVNHARNDGLTPLAIAARTTDIGALGVLLSYGADICAREIADDVAPAVKGASVFASVRRGWDESDWMDRPVSHLLKTYVFAHPDVVKVRSIIRDGDVDGMTLLHTYAKHGLKSCAELVIRRGADVNALGWTYKRRRRDDGASVLDMRQVTPLDLALKDRSDRIENQKQDSRRVKRSSFLSVRSTYDAVIKMLQDEGAKTSTEPTITHPIPKDQTFSAFHGIRKGIK